jgi:drug/metabolite transporter (DMT)-like permease
MSAKEETDDIIIHNSKVLSNTYKIQQEKKSYLNLYCFRLSYGIIYTYMFIGASMAINIVNRVIFLQYKFKFNFTLMLLHQIFCICFFITLSKTSKSFVKMAGQISFSDFLLLKYQYILYSLFFIFKTVVAFLGYQLVVNIPMYVSLRKLLTGMTFVYQYFFKKKKISRLNILEVILLTIGAILTGLDDYSTDIKGYIAVFLKNTTGLINLEVSENFKKKNGVTNLKLLIYNSFLVIPILIITIFMTGEYSRLKTYLNSEHKFQYYRLCIQLFFSCVIELTTNASFFMSNEKNSSLFTQLLSDTKYIFITILSYKVLKTFKFTWKNILGVGITTLAGIIITVNSLYNNIQVTKSKPQTNLLEEKKVPIEEKKEKESKIVKIENNSK